LDLRESELQRLQRKDYNEYGVWSESGRIDLWYPVFESGTSNATAAIGWDASSTGNVHVSWGHFEIAHDWLYHNGGPGNNADGRRVTAIGNYVECNKSGTCNFLKYNQAGVVNLIGNSFDLTTPATAGLVDLDCDVVANNACDKRGLRVFIDGNIHVDAGISIDVDHANDNILGRWRDEGVASYTAVETAQVGTHRAGPFLMNDLNGSGCMRIDGSKRLQDCGAPFSNAPNTAVPAWGDVVELRAIVCGARGVNVNSGDTLEVSAQIRDDDGDTSWLSETSDCTLEFDLNADSATYRGVDCAFERIDGVSGPFALSLYASITDADASLTAVYATCSLEYQIVE
jgi:hypothetical protein